MYTCPAGYLLNVKNCLITFIPQALTQGAQSGRLSTSNPVRPEGKARYGTCMSPSQFLYLWKRGHFLVPVVASKARGV